MEKKPQARKTAASRSAGAVKPKKKTSPSRTKRRQGSTIFALDIGTRTVVGILAEKTEGGIRIIDMETAAHEKRSMTDGQIEDIDAVAQVIKAVKTALEKRRSVKLEHVCIAAAGRALKTMRATCSYTADSSKTLTAEDLSAAELEAVRATEEQFCAQYNSSAFYCVGHSVISRTLDGYKVQKPEGHRGEKLDTEIIAAFLPAYVVESLCAAVDIAGLDVAGLTLEPIAAMNAVVPPELRLINIALCDIGAGTSDVAVSRGGSVVAYGMATVAGDEMTEALMQALLVDFAEAERIKTSPDEEITYTDILLCEHTITAKETAELLRPAAEQLADTICSEITAANSVPPQAVFLVGGGSQLNGLAALVAQRLGLPETRVVIGRRELMRGVEAPAGIAIGAEHATPLGIAMTTGSGVSYDFTTITLNGRKMRTLDTSRLTVFELLSAAGIKPDQLIGRSGQNLAFTIDGEQVTLRGTPAKPAEITVNAKPAALNSPVRKGDDVHVTPAENGESAAAYLSDYYDIESLRTVTVNLFDRDVTAGRYVSVNGEPLCADREIENADEIKYTDASTLGALLALFGENCEALVNGAPAAADALLCDGDIITRSETAAPKPAALTITVNGITADFPERADGKPPIFLDVAAAFCDDPTTLLTNASTVTVNGKIARLDEEIKSGDVIVID